MYGDKYFSGKFESKFDEVCEVMLFVFCRSQFPDFDYVVRIVLYNSLGLIIVSFLLMICFVKLHCAKS